MAQDDDIDAGTALALHQQGRFAEAEPIYRRVLAAEPDNADVLSLLGTLCHQTGRNDEAVTLLRRALEVQPDKANWFANLGLALRGLERYPEAAEALRQALTLRPDYPEALSNLGLVLHQMSDFKQAITSFERAIALNPNMPGLHINLGTTYLHLDLNEEAVVCFQRAVDLNPKYSVAHSNLGMALFKSGSLEAAEAEMRTALALKPDSAEAFRGLGTTLRDQGRMAEALDAYEQAVALDPQNFESRQQLLFVENYLSKGSPAVALERARQLDALISRTGPARHLNVPDPQRRLKIGFVSGDFRRHPVGQFFGHLLPHFDRDALEIVLYANQSTNDQFTAQMKADADHWRSIKALDDEAAEAQIRADEIDILVDLAGHTGGNRMRLFLRGPAPVQATWLGYSGTTGLSAIDYIIVDETVIPPSDDANYSETPIRLPDTYLCYAPPRFSGFTASVAPPPAVANGYVTFGSYNNPHKMSDATVACWAQVLLAVPGSKLLLKAGQMQGEEGRKSVTSRFAEHGIAADRLVLKPRDHSFLLHYQSYSEIDICLDPFPYNGTTTTCDAFWMGVPMVTLAGDRFISRVGASLLRTVGLGDLVAADVESYVAIAAELARNIPRLKGIRATLRDDMLRSPLGDAPRFARSLEAGLREMWRRWCAGQQTRAAS